jgi:membrane-associated PAP2 superfamily phosphatase
MDNDKRSLKLSHMLVVSLSISNATVLKRYLSRILAEILNILVVIVIFFSTLSGHAVAKLVEALCYVLEGRRFESRMGWIFSIDLIIPAAVWHWIRLSL